MKRVLVTGSSGWIGRHCIPILEAKGYEVIEYKGNLLNNHNHVVDNGLGVDQYSKRLPLPQLVNHLGITHLLHLAWIVTPGEYWESPDNRLWFESSIKLIQEFKEGGGYRVVVAGTQAEKTETLYGRSKNSLRRVVRSYCDITGMSYGWGRIYYLYGPEELPGRLVPQAIISMLREEVFTVNHPAQMIDIFHVKDVAGALVALLDSDVEGTVDIGSGISYTIKRVMQIIHKHIGMGDICYRHIPSVDRTVCDVHRLKHEVKFTPEFDLDSGLKDAVGWWRHKLAIERGDCE
jgi:UDP-glucuronate decarboxylase